MVPLTHLLKKDTQATQAASGDSATGGFVRRLASYPAFAPPHIDKPFLLTSDATAINVMVPPRTIVSTMLLRNGSSKSRETLFNLEPFRVLRPLHGYGGIC